MSKQIWKHDGPHKLRLEEYQPRNGRPFLVLGDGESVKLGEGERVFLTIAEAHELMNALSRWLEREVVGPVERGV